MSLRDVEVPHDRTFVACGTSGTEPCRQARSPGASAQIAVEQRHRWPDIGRGDDHPAVAASVVDLAVVGEQPLGSTPAGLRQPVRADLRRPRSEEADVETSALQLDEQTGGRLLRAVGPRDLEHDPVRRPLSRLDHRYSASFGTSGTSAHNPARWLASMRGGSDSADEPTMLDKVMVISVGLALLASGVFFAFFSGGSQMRN